MQTLKVKQKTGLNIPFVDKDGFILANKFVGLNYDGSQKEFDEVPNTTHYQRLVKRGELTLVSDSE